MNEREFILLVEEYLDGTILPDGRCALAAEVKANPERHRLFEEQARQHIRIHAQTSRVDFTESQHIAVMVMDIVEKHRNPNAFMDVIRRKTLRERFAIVLCGLRAGKGTAAYRAAKDEFMRIFGPVTVSLAVNVALILLIFCWVPYALPPPPAPLTKDFIVTINNPDPTPPTLDPKQDIPNPSRNTEPITPVQFANATEEPLTAGPITDMRSGPSEEAVGAIQEHVDFTPMSLTTKSISIGGIKTLQGRDPIVRTGILKQTPGSKATEDAVTRSLRWLRANQSTDGSWAGQDSAAMTGLALLAFLARGETPASPEFGDSITRGLKYLLARQDAQGAFSKNVYAHAIATYAMAEGFTLSRIMELKASLEKGARVIVDGQQNNGGFDYNYRKDQRFDTSVTGWQIQALKAARIANADVPGLEDALARAAHFLQNDAFARDESGFVYEGKTGIPAMTGGKASMTGVGTLCLQMLGKSTAPQVKTGLRALRDSELVWPTSGKAGVYAGYYVTQAKFQGGNPTDWSKWNRRMQKLLLSKQQADGHWEQGDYDNGSHVYTTSLCALMLEVYYRYLPTYEKRPESAPQEKTASGDVSVDIR